MYTVAIYLLNETYQNYNKIAHKIVMYSKFSKWRQDFLMKAANPVTNSYLILSNNTIAIIQL